MKKMIIISVFFLVSWGCTTSSTFSYQQFDTDLFRVTSATEGSAGPQYGTSCFLIGASEATLRTGRKYFSIIEDTSISEYDPTFFFPSIRSSSNIIREGAVRTFFEKPENSSDRVYYEARRVHDSFKEDIKKECLKDVVFTN